MSAQLQPRQPHRYTWSDYQTWPEGERWEIIGGIAYNMCPAPTTRHQQVTGRLYSRLEFALAGKRCTPFIAPTDVKFSEEDVVQPDVLVVCDPSKITPSHIEGAPDLVAEVLSPSTASKDYREKFDLYQRYGVREYLLVDAVQNYVLRFRLEEVGRFGRPEMFAGTDLLPALEGVEIALWEVFELAQPGGAAPEALSKGPEEWR